MTTSAHLGYRQPMPIPLRFTVNAAVDSPDQLATYTLPDFDSLAAELESAREEGTKEGSDLIIPVAEWHTMYRLVQNVAKMGRLFVGDVDAITEDQAVTLLQCLEGASCILYTTHSHCTPKKEGLRCYRVIIELDEEYPVEAHLVLWDAVNEKLGGLLDLGARTAEQGYYLPAYPPGYGHMSEVCRFVGDVWSVSALTAGGERRFSPPVASTGPKVHLAPTEKAPSLLALTAQLNGWVRGQTDPTRKTVGQAAKALLKGKNEIPVGSGQRNNFLIALAGYLAKQWPRSPAEEVAAHFVTIGWDLLNTDGKYPIETLSSMIERMQASECAQLEQTAREIAEKRQKVIERATGGERSEEITPQEVDTLGDIFGPWEQQVVAIFKRDLYFLRPDGTYDPGAVLRESLFVAARDRLAIFGDHIEYTYEDEQGNTRRKTDKGFLEEYGKVVRAVIFDMTRPQGGWDAKAEAILFPAATPQVDPVLHEDIHLWLECLDDHLIDWLAVSGQLGLMLPALVLTGPPACGKTILTKGLGRVYGSDPLDAEVAFSTFNASTMNKQPIIFMDEKVPEIYKREGTSLIRRFLTQGSRMLDEKYQARVELRGYPRIVIAANNIDVLNTNEEMTADDRAAFSERLVHIDLTPGQQYLYSVRARIQKEWLEGNRLAEHIRYLGEHWEVRHPGTRFEVASNQTRLHEGLASRAGFAGDVAYWLLSYVASPDRASAAHLPIEFDTDKGRLRVNTGALVQGWGHYLKDHKPPSPSQISRALRSLATGSKQKITSIGKRLDAHEIDPKLLRSANDTHRLVPNFDDLFKLTISDKLG